MNLICIDLGNSNPHFAHFSNDQLIKIDSIDKLELKDSDTIIVSSVRKTIPYKYHFNLEDFKIKGNFFDMPFDYTETIGIDRLITSYGYFHQKKKANDKFKSLIIDAGTFITFDIITDSGFKGGMIFPGIKTFLDSYKAGENLPKLNFEYKNIKEEIPNNTHNAIIDASNIYLKSILSEVIKMTSPGEILITGGSSEIIFNILNELNLKVEHLKDLHFLLYSMKLIHSLHLKDLATP